VTDIENVVLNFQLGGIPILVKDVAKASVGYLPRLGKAGRDGDDDVVTAIVVMNRTLHTNDVLARVNAEIDQINRDGTLPPGVQAVPFYDRGSLVAVTTHTVLHNLIFGCVLVFLIQWIFLGNLRSAIIVGANIPFALLFSIAILYLTGESANLLSIGAVDFGIIVDSAVILVENVFRNLQAPEAEQRHLLGTYISAEHARGWTEQFQMIFASALQVDRAILFSTAMAFDAHLRPRMPAKIRIPIPEPGAGRGAGYARANTCAEFVYSIGRTIDPSANLCSGAGMVRDANGINMVTCDYSGVWWGIRIVLPSVPADPLLKPGQKPQGPEAARPGSIEATPRNDWDLDKGAGLMRLTPKSARRAQTRSQIRSL
jgi:hypothetical protein